jgi:hypothetical protein
MDWESVPLIPLIQGTLCYAEVFSGKNYSSQPQTCHAEKPLQVPAENGVMEWPSGRILGQSSWMSLSKTGPARALPFYLAGQISQSVCGRYDEYLASACLKSQDSFTVILIFGKLLLGRAIFKPCLISIAGTSQHQADHADQNDNGNQYRCFVFDGNTLPILTSKDYPFERVSEFTCLQSYLFFTGSCSAP